MGAHKGNRAAASHVEHSPADPVPLPGADLRPEPAERTPLEALQESQDITERKRAEEALRQSEELHRVSFELAAVGMVYVTPEGRILEANDKYCQITGYAREELVGQSVLRLMHPEDRPGETEDFKRYARGEQEAYTTEKRYLRKDGSVCWVAVTARMIHHADGRPRHSIGIIQDITERKQVEQALRESERRLKRSQEIAHLGSWELDLITDHLTWSDEVYRIFGLEPQQFGATYEAFLEAVHPEDRQAVDAAYTASLREGRDTYEVEHRIIRKSTGEQRIVHEKCEHLRDGSGRIIRSAGMIHDITERRQADEALARAKAELERHNTELEQRVHERTVSLKQALVDMEHFSYAIVHDMRAPLRAMQCFAELAQQQCTAGQDSPIWEYMQRIKTATRRMDDLIRDSLSYSKAVGQTLPLSPVDLESLMRDLIETYPHLQPDQADIMIEGRIPLVLGNAAGLGQCFGNLLGNAVKFARPGIKPSVRIWAGDPQPGTGGMVRVWVEDNGIGIPKTSQQRIFDMFQRNTTEHEGTGIGLTIVRKVVHRMRGRVGVESEEGQGSRFWVELPKAT